MMLKQLWRIAFFFPCAAQHLKGVDAYVRRTMAQRVGLQKRDRSSRRA
jgi:hypothetical protein